MAEEKLTVSELEEQIEECKRRIADAEGAIAENPDSNRAQMLSISVRSKRAELVQLEKALDEAKAELGPVDEDEAKIKAALDENRKELDDIAAQIAAEDDHDRVNNLVVAQRFLQMERNQLLIRLTGETRTEDDYQHELDELRRNNESKTRIIQDLNAKMQKLQKDLAVANTMANAQERAQCDETRVTVTAGRLASLRNESKRLAAENYDLRQEISDLKRQMDMMHRNIGELTAHCRAADGQITEMQERITGLSGQLVTAKDIGNRLKQENDGLRATIRDHKY